MYTNQVLHFSTIFMKMYKNQALCFSSIFTTPGCMKILKNQVLCFSSIFMTPIKHENVHKSGAPFFYNFHENVQKSCALFFSNFHDPEVMKIHKNQAKGKTKLTESPIVFITPYQQCLAVCSMMQFEAQTSLYVFKLVYCHIGEAESSIESSTSRNRNKTRPQP